MPNVCHFGHACVVNAILVRSSSFHQAPEAVHFLPLLGAAVILLVVIRSPMYFCRNLLLLSSLSCSSLTASMRLKMVRRESWRAFACLFNSSRASLPSASISSLVRRGLMALTSSGPNSASMGPTAELSRGTTSGPLLFRLGKRGRMGVGWWI